VKFLTVIIAFYILSLNLVPCEDGFEGCEDAQIEISQNSEDHGHNNIDFCSPFCQCQCCQINVTFNSVSIPQIIPDPISTEVFLYVNRLESNISFSILRPPQAVFC